jgi:hypothetical protein
MANEKNLPAQGTTGLPEKSLFAATLTRTVKEVRQSQALRIYSRSQMVWKRAIEDICNDIEMKKVDVDYFLDAIAPASLTDRHAVDETKFDAEKFMKMDVEAHLCIRDLRIQLQISLQRYEYWFGPFPEKELVEKALKDDNTETI